MRFLSRSRSGALVLGIAAAGTVAIPASASASTSASSVAGHVYLNDDTKGTNTIGAFDRHVVSSGGALPDSVAVHGNLAYVANSGTGDANYSGFRLGFMAQPSADTAARQWTSPGCARSDGNPPIWRCAE